MNTEDKTLWCDEYGLLVEQRFVIERLFSIGMAGFINPEKRLNPYVHDLFLVSQSDVKTVRTPYFKSYEKHGIDPQYAVTFNLKDGERYYNLYPNIAVIFDVKWEGDACRKELSGKTYTVEPMHLTAVGFLSQIWSAIQADGTQIVEYQRRTYDTAGNAKASYVFDIRRLHPLNSTKR